MQIEQSLLLTWTRRAFRYSSRKLGDMGSGDVISWEFFAKIMSSSQMGRLTPSFKDLILEGQAVGQPTQTFDGPLGPVKNCKKYKDMLFLQHRWKRERSNNAQPSNDLNASPRYSNVMGWPNVRQAAAFISGISLFRHALANRWKDPAPVGESNPLRLTSVRMEDCTVVMSYFWEAASRVKILSSESGISGEMGYNIVMRLFRTSASSGKCTAGRPSMTSWSDPTLMVEEEKTSRRKKVRIWQILIYGCGN
jgi:hypothetical protein